MADALRQVEGAYSLVALTQDGLIGVRDPLGVRPLVLGRLGDAWILASETCALDIIGADFVRDIEPGEMVIIGPGGVQQPHALRARAASASASSSTSISPGPTASIEGISVYEARKRIGAELARESHVAADIVIPVPDSGVPAAHRLCRSRSGCPSSSASSATIMSAAPSSSRPTRSAIWA